MEGRYSTALYSAAYKSKTLEKTETELKAFEVGTSLTKPWPLPATLQSISGCLSHREKTKNQTDQSNASYTKSSPSTVNLIGQTYQSIVFPQWDKQPEIKRMLHNEQDAVKFEVWKWVWPCQIVVLLYT